MILKHQDNINRNDMFSTQIWTMYIDHIDNEAIAKYLLAKEQEDTEGQSISAIGGWQSDKGCTATPHERRWRHLGRSRCYPALPVGKNSLEEGAT